ncbi:hypothetical protein HFN92_18035 [Rhizobium laguerreae]|nr:hypothetical protein [Rhizobium laguerreae]
MSSARNDEISSILPTFTTILTDWWGTYGRFFGVAIGGAIYFVLRMGAAQAGLCVVTK